jgi:hypothetical protein
MERESENPFAAIIRSIRGETPQGIFADRLGIKQAKYSHYENRRREPSLDELCRIAKALNTTPNVLLGFEALSISPHKIIAGDNSPVAVVTGNGNSITQNIHTSKRKRGTNENAKGRIRN